MISMSKHPYIFTVLTVVLLVAAAPALAGTLEEDLKLMMTWFEGEFDNHLQFLEDEENPPEQPHEWIHSIFKPVDLPAFGDNVFYVEQYTDGDPSKIYRNRIYSYSLSEDEGAIQLTIYSPTDPMAVAGAHEDPSKLAGLTPDAMRTIPGCEVFWKNDGGERFIGYMKEGACRIDSKRMGKTIIIHDDLVLTPDEIWISDRAEDEDGNWVFGNRAGIHHKLKRSRNFACWMTLKDEESDEWKVVERGLVLHDQGGSAKIAAEGEGAPVYKLELEQRVYEGERRVEVLKLGVYRDEEEKSLAYTWSEPDSTNIGMNLRWFQAGCTAE
jgi:hypothetical protein